MPRQNSYCADQESRSKTGPQNASLSVVGSPPFRRDRFHQCLCRRRRENTQHKRPRQRHRPKKSAKFTTQRTTAWSDRFSSTPANGQNSDEGCSVSANINAGDTGGYFGKSAHKHSLRVVTEDIRITWLHVEHDQRLCLLELRRQFRVGFGLAFAGEFVEIDLGSRTHGSSKKNINDPRQTIRGERTSDRQTGFRSKTQPQKHLRVCACVTSFDVDAGARGSRNHQNQRERERERERERAGRMRRRREVAKVGRS